MSIPETLGHYRILGPLGKGGMGEVHAAEDMRLHRRVAIKVLPPQLAADPERRQRLEREAQVIAALNHPNIVTIHSVEEDQGILFLTMELVEGKPLGDIAGSRGLPLDSLLRIGIAVSDAMAAAHQRGVTHRDLKPGNIMVTPDGRVKVLDFGLAKLREAQSEAAADEVTRPPSNDLTGEGRIIGTVAYMSPEQAEGKPADQRSDIFSLGVVLHELATGQKPFKGDSTVSLISSILKDTPPPVTAINPSLPPGLARVIRRSLAKDPSRRYQTATDVRNELEDLEQESGSVIAAAAAVAPPRPVPGRRRAVDRATAAAAAVLLFAAILLGYTYWKAGGEPGGDPFLDIGRLGRLTTTGHAALAAISPDGRYVAHVKNDPGAPSLWMRQTATTSDVQIVPPAAVRYDGVTYSPEGDHVYFVTYGISGGLGTLYRVAALGGPPQKVLEDVDSEISFSLDRKQFAFTRGFPAEDAVRVMVASADGSEVRRLAELEKPDQVVLNGPAWSADGKTIVVAARSLRDGPHFLVVGIDVATGAATRLEGRWTGILDLDWVPGTDSFVLAATEVGLSSPQLWQIRYPTGERRRLTYDLNGYTSLSISQDASSLAAVQTEAVSNLWVSSATDPASGVQITRGRGRADGQGGLDWTPDGRIVFVSGASGEPQIWIADADGRNAQQLTAAEQEPVFGLSVTPDGRHVIFQRMAARHMRIWRMNMDGSEQRWITDGSLDQGPVAAPGGLVYFLRVVPGGTRAFRVSIDGGAPVQVSEDPFRPIDVSADGAQLLGVLWNATAQRSSLAIMPATGGAPRLLDAPSFNGSFTADGKGVIYPAVERGAVRVDQLDLASGKVATFGSVRDFVFHGALSPDGKRLVLSRGGVISDVVLVTMKHGADE